MTHSWPHGVTSDFDMEYFVEMLFGDCQIENLLTNTPWDHKPGIMLVRCMSSVVCCGLCFVRRVWCRACVDAPLRACACVCECVCASECVSECVCVVVACERV